MSERWQPLLETLYVVQGDVVFGLAKMDAQQPRYAFLANDPLMTPWGRKGLI